MRAFGKLLYIPLICSTILQSCASALGSDAELFELMYQQQKAKETAEVNRLLAFKAQIRAAENRGEINKAEAAKLIYDAEQEHYSRIEQRKAAKKSAWDEQQRQSGKDKMEDYYRSQELALKKQALAQKSTQQGLMLDCSTYAGTTTCIEI